MKNNTIKKKLKEKPIYIKYFSVGGVYEYKSKFILNLCNTNINKKHSSFNKLDYECMSFINRHSTLNTGLLKKNTVKLNNKRKYIIRKNENKNISKKNM